MDPAKNSEYALITMGLTVFNFDPRIFAFVPYITVAANIKSVYGLSKFNTLEEPDKIKIKLPKKPIDIPMMWFDAIFFAKNKTPISNTKRGVVALRAPARLLGILLPVIPKIMAGIKYPNSPDSNR